MIPVCEPTLKGNEKKYVDQCLDSNWISSGGKFIQEFEGAFSKYCGVKHGVSCSSGTAALHLALRSIGIGKGDEVIVPDFSIISLANSVIYCGARPVFVDSEPKTWNIDPRKIEEKITAKTKAIMAMHTYGCPADMDAIRKVADSHGLKVVEDAAEAHGAMYKGRRAGSLGDVSAFSFYANKIITAGEGGMVLTDEKSVAERAMLLRNHAFTQPRFVHHEIGFNYRMTNIQAAIGVAQMEHVEELVKARQENARAYNACLSGLRGISLPPECPYGESVYWMYGLLVDEERFGIGRDEVMRRLLEKGIETRPFFYPMHLQPVFRAAPDVDCAGEYPVSERLGRQGLYLPSSSHLGREQIMGICAELKSLAR